MSRLLLFPRLPRREVAQGSYIGALELSGLIAPFPYYGGKRRSASIIWERLGNPTVYVEPCAGSIAVLLARPDGAGPREVVCDVDGLLCNFWRAVSAEPHATALYASWPTVHQDLTARHIWLRRWAVENAEQLSLDPDFYDVKAAGWWVWGISNWIGGSWCAVDTTLERRMPAVQPNGGGRGVNAQRRPLVGTTGGGAGVSAQRVNMPVDQIPYLDPKSGGKGITAQRETMPTAKIPHVDHKGGGQGISAQRETMPTAQMPRVGDKNGGRGVSAQRVNPPPEQRPFVQHTGGGQGVSVQRDNWPGDQIPHVGNKGGGQGINAQRLAPGTDKRPYVDSTGGFGRGVQAQRASRTHDQIPKVADWPGGNGVQAQRTNAPRGKMPKIGDEIGGRGVQAQRVNLDILDWFERLQERLYKVVVLNRSWQSAVTPTILQQTESARRGSVGVLLDPPYLTGDRSDSLYTSDSDGQSNTIAVETYKWAVEHGDRYRIAYCCHSGDFPVPPGWDSVENTFGGIKLAERNERKRDMIMFSPACTPKAKPQPGLFDGL